MTSSLVYPLDEFRPFKSDHGFTLEIFVFGKVEIDYGTDGLWNVGAVTIKAEGCGQVTLGLKDPLRSLIIFGVENYERGAIQQRVNEALAKEFPGDLNAEHRTLNHAQQGISA
jgi:hypothetical protein